MNKALLLSICILILSAHHCKAQLDDLSVTLLAQQQPMPQQQQYYVRKGNDKSLMQTKQKNIVATYNPITLTFKGLMLFYQNILSPQLSKECPYYYTCSNYAKMAIHEYGIIKGILLAGDRLMRCNRISLMDINDMWVDEKTHTIVDEPSMY